MGGGTRAIERRFKNVMLKRKKVQFFSGREYRGANSLVKHSFFAVPICSRDYIARL